MAILGQRSVPSYDAVKMLDALLDALIFKGILTREEAARIAAAGKLPK